MLKCFRVPLSTIAVVALTLSAVTGLGVVPASAAMVMPAVEDVVGDMIYSADSSAVGAGATVTSYLGPEGAVVIPATVTLDSVTYAVKKIGYEAFRNRGLTALTIPSSVTTIDNGAFALNQLTTVTIPSSVTQLGEFAFFDNALTSVTLPSALTAINVYAFGYNELTSVSIPSTVTTIGARAFNSNKLTSVTIPSSVTSLGEAVFQNNLLASVSIPSSLTTIAVSAFAHNNLTSVTIPETVTEIGVYAFEDNLLTSVKIPDAVVSVGGASFADNQLTSVRIGNSVADLGNSAFIRNELTSVTIPASVTYMDRATFVDNPLVSVFMRGAAPTIAPAAVDGSFGEGTNLTVYYPAASSAGYASPWSGYSTAVAELFETESTPAIVGTAQVGQTLTAHAGTWSQSPTLSYAWTHAGSGPVLGTAATYVPTGTDVSRSLTVTVTATAVGYQPRSLTSVATTAVASATFAVKPTPTIFGTKQVGQILSVDAGAWPVDAVLSYAWKRVGSSATVGTTARYAPVGADVGKKLTVSVTATLSGFTSASKTSAPTTAVVAGTLSLAPVPTVSGTKTSGKTLTAVTGTWTSGVAFTYAWKRSGSTATIGTSARYTLTAADIGKKLTVTVKGTRSGFTSLSKTSVATATVVGASFVSAPVPTITGFPATGSTLVAVVGPWSPSDGVTFSYVWKRASTPTGTKTAITGATGRNYDVATADLGKYLTVTVTATKTGYVSTSKTSVNMLVAP
jgi:hypothetical protein